MARSTVIQVIAMPARTSQRDELLNALCDTDSLWGPMLSLRPAKEKSFSSPRLLVVCSLFGISHGMCANAAYALTHELGGRGLPPVYAAPLLLALIGFACGKLAFLGAWNRRAERLSRQLAWVDATHRTPRN